MGYHVSTEQTHVLPTVDGIPDWRQANIVFSRAGMQSLVDVVVSDPTGASMVSSAAPGGCPHPWACNLSCGPTQGGGVCHSPSWGFILPLCGGGFWGSSPGLGPVPPVLSGPVRGAAAVPPDLGGYGLS
ncbi:unnamed protein product [Calypogeia fissa]